MAFDSDLVLKSISISVMFVRMQIIDKFLYAMCKITCCTEENFKEVEEKIALRKNNNDNIIKIKA